jgi:hypothetical protein
MSTAVSRWVRYHPFFRGYSSLLAGKAWAVAPAEAGKVNVAPRAVLKHLPWGFLARHSVLIAWLQN